MQNNPAREALADLDALLILAAGARTSDDGTLAGRSRIFYDLEAASAAEKRLRAFLTRAVGEEETQYLRAALTVIASRRVPYRMDPLDHASEGLLFLADIAERALAGTWELPTQEEG